MRTDNDGTREHATSAHHKSNCKRPLLLGMLNRWTRLLACSSGMGALGSPATMAARGAEEESEEAVTPTAGESSAGTVASVGSVWGESSTVAMAAAAARAAETCPAETELRRWERYGDDAHAVERWNQLVADRSKLTPPSEAAAQALRERGLLQPGTRTVRAFQVDDRTIVGVYLLTPSEPENATVLEKISFLPDPSAPAQK